MEFDELIKAFADEVGFANGLSADEDGVVRVPVADGGAIAFMEVSQARSLLMWCRICDLPELNANRMRDILLKANFMGQLAEGTSLSLSDDNGIYLHRYLPLDLTDVNRFMEAVTAFVEAIADLGVLVAKNAFAPDDRVADDGGELAVEDGVITMRV